MSPRAKRLVLDAAISLPVLVICGHFGAWWLPFPVALFGCWNFYDGMTRELLEKETATKSDGR